MELRIAPTSPKKNPERNQSISQAGTEGPNVKKRSKSTVGLYIFAAVVGVIAGASSALILFTQSNWFGFITNTTPITRVVSGDTSNTFSQNESALLVLQAKVSPSILMLYYAAPSNQNNSFQPPFFAGEAVFLTSDGIAMTTLSAVLKNSDLIAVNANGTTQTITDIYRDSVSGLAFFRFQGNGFTAVQLKKQDDLFPKSSLYAFWQENRYDIFGNSSAQLRLALKNTPSPISSEDFFLRVTLAQEHVQFPQGTLLFSGDGSLYAMYSGTSDDPSVVYLPDRRESIDSYVASKKIKYPYLGVHGFDLSTVLYQQGETSLGFSKGFLLASDSASQTLAVTPKSPAAATSLKEGDIITKVGSTPLDASHSLSFLLLSSPASVELTIQRGTKEMVIHAELQELPQ